MLLKADCSALDLNLTGLRWRLLLAPLDLARLPDPELLPLLSVFCWLPRDRERPQLLDLGFGDGGGEGGAEADLAGEVGESLGEEEREAGLSSDVEICFCARTDTKISAL